MKQYKRQIAVDVRMLHNSGIGKVIENILKRLIPAQPEWLFYLIGNKKEIQDFSFGQADNTNIIDCRVPIYSAREQLVLPGKIPNDTDVFWAPHYNIPVLYGGKLVVTIHDMAHLAMPQFVHGIHKHLYAKYMMRAAVKKASTIVTVSEFSKKEIIKYTSVDSKKIQVVYNGVDESWFRIPKGIPKHSRPYMIFVGNVKPNKNLGRLLEAFAMVKDKVPYDLILVGKKEGFLSGDESIKEKAKALGERVSFTGYVTDEELQQYVSQADAMVFPSLYEGFGLPPLEAMAAGCPVLTSNAASLPEVCGNSVVYFNPMDVEQMARTLLGPIKQPDEKWAGRFSWDIATKKLKDFLA